MNWGFKREWARDVRPGGPMGSMHDVSAEVALTRITDRAITCGTYRVTPARARRILGVGPLLLAMLAGFHTKGFAAQGPTPAVSAPMSDTLHDVPNFVHLIARVKPAVVSVTSRVKLSNATRNGQTLGSRQRAPPFNRPSLREKAPRELMAETR